MFTKRGEEREEKKKKIKFLKFGGSLMNKKNNRACMNTDYYGQLPTCDFPFFIISVISSQSTIADD